MAKSTEEYLQIEKERDNLKDESINLLNSLSATENDEEEIELRAKLTIVEDEIKNREQILKDLRRARKKIIDVPIVEKIPEIKPSTEIIEKALKENEKMKAQIESYEIKLKPVIERQRILTNLSDEATGKVLSVRNQEDAAETLIYSDSLTQVGIQTKWEGAPDKYKLMPISEWSESETPSCILPKWSDEVYGAMLRGDAEFMGNAYREFVKQTYLEFLTDTNKMLEFPKEKWTFNTIPSQHAEQFGKWFELKFQVPFYTIKSNDPYDITNLRTFPVILMAQTVNDILEERKSKGIVGSIHPRGIFYIVTQRRFCKSYKGFGSSDFLLVPWLKRSADYGNLSTLVATARYAGLIKFDAIHDATFDKDLELVLPPEKPRGFTLMLDYITKRPLRMLSPLIIIYIEKTGIDTIIDAVGQSIPLVRVSSTKGEMSTTIAWKIVEYIRKNQQPTIVFTLTDNDPEGNNLGIRGFRKVIALLEREKVGVPVSMLPLGIDYEDEEQFKLEGITPLEYSSKSEARYFALDAFYALNEPILYLIKKISNKIGTYDSWKSKITQMQGFDDEFGENVHNMWLETLNTPEMTRLREKYRLSHCNEDTAKDLENECAINNVINKMKQNPEHILNKDFKQLYDRLNKIGQDAITKAEQIEVPKAEWSLALPVTDQVPMLSYTPEFWKGRNDVLTPFKFDGSTWTGKTIENIDEKVSEYKTNYEEMAKKFVLNMNRDRKGTKKVYNSPIVES